MKKFYHNNVGCNTAIIKCKKGSSDFNLYYHLYDNPVQHIWQNIHSQGQGIRTCNLSTLPTTVITDKLKKRCIEVGMLNIPELFDQTFLNKLHNDFVLSNKNDAWHDINHLIHTLEDRIDNPFSEYDSTINFYSLDERYELLKEEHKIFLDTDIRWGRMNLGYGTLGKDWIDIASNNDSLDDLALHTTISSEALLAFCVEPGIPGRNNVKFYNWAKDKNNIPTNNLNKLSLGRYPLGQLIITDVFLDFHSNASDWYVPNHCCKLQWNKQVFNSEIEITEIKFENTDMLFNSFVAHSKITELINV